MPSDRAQNKQMKEDLINAANMFRELQALEIGSSAVSETLSMSSN